MLGRGFGDALKPSGDTFFISGGQKSGGEDVPNRDVRSAFRFENSTASAGCVLAGTTFHHYG
jgi:hypothetical protein